MTGGRDSGTVRWIRTRLALSAHLGRPPRFGSSEWHALPDDDPRKHAAVLVAAACWWDSCRSERIAQQLRDELLAARQVSDDEFALVAAKVRRHAYSPSHAEIVRRWAS